jgi:hypothetical protein
LGLLRWCRRLGKQNPHGCGYVEEAGSKTLPFSFMTGNIRRTFLCRIGQFVLFCLKNGENMKRQLSEAEKSIVRQQQQSSDGSLRCFISGEIISEQDDIKYDRILPYSKDGETDIPNIRVVLKKYNRRKSDQSLYDVRDNLKIERLF